MFDIIRYTPGHKAEWNAFVARSKNGTFLFDRDYMDYHSDRFEDHSLMFYLDGRLYALMPANRKDDVFQSHAGLTYGGLVMDAHCTAAAVVTLFAELNDYLRREGFRRVYYKCIPWMYHQLAAEEDLYAICRTCDARLQERDLGTVIIQRSAIRWERVRRRALKRAQEAGITVERSSAVPTAPIVPAAPIVPTAPIVPAASCPVCGGIAAADLAAFWQVLCDNLRTTYGSRPVHTLDEITLLASRFPDNIVLYTARKDGDILAGILLYVSAQVARAQYSSATPLGKKLGAIDIIYDRIIHDDYAHLPYFEFGTSAMADSNAINETLVFQKEGFGGRAICFDRYEWEL